MKRPLNNWHFPRPTLAKAYLDLFELGLTSARGLFARRRMGKTEFLKRDFIPEAIDRGYVVAYTNLWDLEIDPATALISEFYKAIAPKGVNKILSQFKLPISKIKASGKIPGIGEGAIEAGLVENKKLTGTLLMEAMKDFDKTKIQMILVIDEAQVLAYEENAHFAHALRAALDIRKDRINVIFAGSSETTLRRMFGVPSEPFYNWYRDALLRRLTRYRHNNVPCDFGGRYLYVRDNADGDFWSPSWQPTRSELEHYECRQGLSYTTIGAARRGIRAQTLYYVPLGEDLEVWRLSVTNERRERSNLSIFSAIEFCLWDASDDSTNGQRNLNTGEVEVRNGVIYHKTEYRERRNHYAFFACSEPLAGFDTQRETFLGAYGSWEAPAAVAGGASFDSIAHGWAPIGSHHVRLDLEPGETREVIFLLGYQENPVLEKFDPPGSQTVNKRRAEPVLEHWLSPQAAERGMAALRAYWGESLAVLNVDTPDADTNRMVNIWNPYQNMVTFNLSRSISSFESGTGRGMGFRDSSQDLLGCLSAIPDRARERILDLAATQLPSGGAYHQYQPLTKRGNHGIGSGFNDDPLWLILAVCAYVKETGDAGILEALAPYDNEPGSETPLYEHLQRCVRYTLERLGPHGLPLIGRADWNDCLNLNCFSEQPGESFQTTANREGGVAESVFIAGLFVLAARELAALARLLGEDDDASRYEIESTTMASVVDEHGWDGAWFRRAYDYFGEPVGSALEPEGKIFVEPQGICVMAGIGTADGRAKQALASVREHLATEHGVMLVQPAFTSYQPRLGEITSYPPGYKENASVFCHTNAWVLIAAAMSGDADGAFDYYKRTNPSARAAISEIHRCEPYCYAQTIAGRDAPTHGEAKNSWLTGTASWHLVAVTQWILGIRPELDGLRIDPVLPSDWEGFSATRRWRGATYEITVTKAKGEAGRVRSLVIDGKLLEGNLIAPAPTGATLTVEAIVESLVEGPAANGTGEPIPAPVW